MDLAQIRALVATEMTEVDRLIERRLHSEVTLINQVSQYIIQSGGKRLRPMLVLLGARAFNCTDSTQIDLAAIIEFIHTATLLHDDVVDASALRRGHNTANAIWGNEASVLVGDFLYSRAFQMMVGVGNMRIMEIMAETTNVIAEGEVLQLLNCHEPDTTEEQYLTVIRSKTAKLFEASGRLGPVLAGASAAQEEALAAYGRHLGTAYQLVDDVLDYRGSSDEIGKNVGDDLAEGKPTLPLIFTIRNGEPTQAAAVRKAIESGGRDDIETVVDAVESAGAITYTARAAQAEAELAMEALGQVPASSTKDALIALADFSVSRTF
ncbi:MAG: octaprenyl diphosphate synthase [Gammaproteobacteria bacterium]|nr:MAG: octaprenyl diphosphate synthase [Gammaproteobacteria bacterium]